MAQTGNNRLTNAKIESMLMAGLPESTIQMKIEAAALRGLVDLDASSNALIALKQKNAAERVLNAVVWAEPFGALRKRQQDEDRAVPGLPSSAGVYYKGPSEWVRLRSFFLWPPLYSSRNVSFRRSHEYNVPLGGSHADLQICELHPAFYLREPAAEGWHLVRLALDRAAGWGPLASKALPS